MATGHYKQMAYGRACDRRGCMFQHDKMELKLSFYDGLSSNNGKNA